MKGKSMAKDNNEKNEKKETGMVTCKCIVGLLNEGGKKYTVGSVFETTPERFSVLAKAKFVEAVETK
jgi:hypothetical protein